MGISVFPAPSLGVPVTGVYINLANTTYTLPTALSAGDYKLTTDTSQGGTVNFISAEGYSFATTLRNGIGFIVLPVAVTQIRAASSGGFFPLYLEQQAAPLTPTAAPTSVSWTWTGNNGSAQVGTLSATAPAGATNLTVYWTDGTNQSFGNTNSTQTNVVAKANVTVAGQSRNFLVVATDANGLNSLGAAASTGNSPSQTYTQTFTTSTSWVSPVSGTVEVLAVAGGGGGASGASTDGQGGNGSPGGGGSGGQVSYNSSVSVSNGTSYTITVGNGGNGGIVNGTGQVSGSSGTGSSFGTLVTANTGGGGGTGGAAGSGGGAGGNYANGGNGTSNSITGTAVVYSSGGGGGGAPYSSTSGFNAGYLGGTGAGNGGRSGYTSATNGENGTNYGSGGGGGGAAWYPGLFPDGGNGRQGVVIVKWTA